MRVVVGRIGRAHGIRGEVSVELRTDEPDRRFARGTTLQTSARPLTVASTRRHQGRLLVTFDGVPDRTAAEALRGTVLEAEVDADDRPADDEEFYDHQLVGLAVRRGDDQVGTVTDVLHLPEQDLLVVAIAGPGVDGPGVDDSEVMVPFVADLVPTVDLAAGHLVVADRPGLLDPEAADVAGSTGE